jgi:hypothetical protein
MDALKICCVPSNVALLAAAQGSSAMRWRSWPPARGTSLAADHGDTNALWQLAWLREQAGDRIGAETLALHAADRGNTNVLRLLAGRRLQTGDRSSAETLALQAANRGGTTALRLLADLRRRADDGRTDRFGLNDDGTTANSAPTN